MSFSADTYNDVITHIQTSTDTRAELLAYIRERLGVDAHYAARLLAVERGTA